MLFFNCEIETKRTKLLDNESILFKFWICVMLWLVLQGKDMGLFIGVLTGGMPFIMQLWVFRVEQVCVVDLSLEHCLTFCDKEFCEEFDTYVKLSNCSFVCVCFLIYPYQLVEDGHQQALSSSRVIYFIVLWSEMYVDQSYYLFVFYEIATAAL